IWGENLFNLIKLSLNTINPRLSKGKMKKMRDCSKIFQNNEKINKEKKKMKTTFFFVVENTIFP
ncbi:MAG: hypothetical protein ACTSR3_12690, partial [Candidatus Helarchaeota archaeon]